VTDLLYNGFYCFEALTERNLDDTICGICGVVGEVYLSDGDEKNCCSRKEITYNTDDSVDSSGPVPLEDLLEQIKYQWVERCTFTRSSKPFSVQGSSIPPVIAPKLRGEVILNTEMQKKSLLKKGKTAVEGSQCAWYCSSRIQSRSIH